MGSPVLNTSKLHKHQNVLHTDQNLFEEEDIVYQYAYDLSPQPNWREISSSASAFTEQKHSFQPDSTLYQPTSIIIQLKRVYLVNNITLELKNSSSQYTIQVSRDTETWRQLIDYSRLMTCTGRQVLWFPKQAVRYHITLSSISLHVSHASGLSNSQFMLCCSLCRYVQFAPSCNCTVVFHSCALKSEVPAFSLRDPGAIGWFLR